MTLPPRILVVEDNPTTLKMLTLVLEGEGFHVVAALDARTALKAASETTPDLVLQDLILPDVSGFELVRQLRGVPGGADVPILGISGFLGIMEDQRCIEAGFTDILVKPVEPLRLIEAVRAYLPSPSVAPEVRTSNRRLLIVDDDVVQLKLERIHFTLLGFHVTTATSAAEGLRLARVARPDVVLSDVLMPDMDGFELSLELRREPSLAGVPVVLLSEQYRTRVDEELATEVGANALVPRLPGLADAESAVIAALERRSPARSSEPSPEVKLEHARAIIRRLERQLAIGSGLAQRCTFQAAQLSLLSGVADALATNADPDVAMRDTLASILDAAGISKGALLLKPIGGRMSLRHSIGFLGTERAELETFFGHASLLERAVENQSALSIPSSPVPAGVCAEVIERAGTSSVHIVPLISDGHGVGVIVLAARRTDVTSEDAVAFARAMGNQMVQSLALATAFSRLAASEARYRTLLQSANDAIAVLSPAGIIGEVNHRWEEIAGKPESELVGTHVNELALHDREVILSAADQLGPPSELRRARPVEMRKPDGSMVLLEFSNTPLEFEGEHLVFTIGRDVTTQVRAQEQLLISDRMASVGALAASVAHEINNPLAAVVGNLEFVEKELRILRRDTPSKRLEGIGEAVDDMRAASERVRNIVGDLRVFSRTEDERSGPVDIHQVLDSSLRIASNEIRHRARLVKEYGAVLPVLGSESRLGQVFLNLLVNAAQAIPEGHADSNFIHLTTRYDDVKNQVVVEVRDTGAGIPLHVLPKLFSPFFTTKPADSGTGLGLAICKRIVTGFGGDIEVESTVGEGATFRVTLPATQALPRGPSSVPTSAPLVRRGRILVVDDEPMIGKLAIRCLAGDHEVRAMDDAVAALELITRGERYDVILCDLMMPIMSGFELHDAIQGIAPDQAARMVFLTGGAFTPKARAFLANVPNARLKKPFRIAALLSIVNARLR